MRLDNAQGSQRSQGLHEALEGLGTGDLLRSSILNTARLRWIAWVVGLVWVLAGCVMPAPLVQAPPAGTATAAVAPPTALPVLPKVVGQVGGHVLAVAVADGMAYVGRGARVVALDMADPENPTVLAESSVLPGIVHDLALQDDRLLVAAGSAGLIQIGIGDPLSLPAAGSLTLPLEAQAVQVTGNLAAVAAGSCAAENCQGSLVLVDVSDPGSMEQLAILPLPSFARNLVLGPSLAYVAHDQGLAVVDVARPESPRLVASYGLEGGAQAVAVGGLGGETLLAAGGSLWAFDLSQPAAPIQLAAYEAVHLADTLAISGTVAYVSEGFCEFGLCGSRMLMLDFSKPAQPRELGAFQMTGVVADLVLTGPYAFLAAGEQGLAVVDVSDPAVAVTGGHYRTLGAVTDLDLAGDLAAVGDGDQGGLRILSLTDPETPQLLASFEAPRWANGLVLASSAADGRLYGYVPAWEDGLAIVSLVDAAQPQIIGTLAAETLGGAAYALALDPPAATAFVALGEAGLGVVDVSNPGEPEVLARLASPGEAWGVARVAGLAGQEPAVYVAGGLSQGEQRNGFLQAVDLSTPEDPKSLALLDLPHEAWDVVAVDGVLYLATATCAYRQCQGGLAVVDPADLAGPRLVTTLELEGGALSVTVRDNRAYIPVGASGFWIVDLSDPLQPRTLGLVPTPGSAQQVQVYEDGSALLLFVADGAGGLLILEEQGSP